MAPHIFRRQENLATTNNIADGLIAGFICIVLLLSLLCFLRFHRSEGNKKRNGEWSVTSFHCITGGVRPTMTEANPLSTSIPPFSRCELTASIAMPEKSITRKPSSRGLTGKTVVSSKLESSPTSALFRHRPPSNASFGAPRPRPLSILNPARSRQSRSSSGSPTYAQYSFPSSRSPSTISTSVTQVEPVHQLFDPVLPDELSPLRYGEHLVVLRSFDDGWCLVARDRSRSSRASRLSAMMKSNGDNVDIGLVPAWVFVKPTKSITVTRPFRTASANALNLGQTPPPAYARGTIVSWSNFA